MQWPSKVIFGSRQPFRCQDAMSTRLAYNGLILAAPRQAPGIVPKRGKKGQKGGAISDTAKRHMSRPGIEPGARRRTNAWQRRILPLNHRLQ